MERNGNHATEPPIPCTCVRCLMCHGHGEICWVKDFGYEPCLTCEGSGILRVCERCRAIEAAYQPTPIPEGTFDGFHVKQDPVKEESD